MSKKVARRRKNKGKKFSRKSIRKPAIIICALLLLTFIVGVTAQWKILPGSSKPMAIAPVPQSGFTAQNPSKEYIYAGGRLIATEEPGSGVPPSQTPYSGQPIAIPGTIQAEDFDNGGEGVAYHDSDPENRPGQFEAFKHAMVPGPWVKKYGLEKATQMAQAAMLEFINGNLSRAKKYFDAAKKNKDYRPAWRAQIADALYRFGMAIHPIMDSWSPAHKGWQVYDLSGDLGRDVAGLLVHKGMESRSPTVTEMTSMRHQLQMMFRSTFSKGFYNVAINSRRR